VGIQVTLKGRDTVTQVRQITTWFKTYYTECNEYDFLAYVEGPSFTITSAVFINSFHRSMT